MARNREFLRTIIYRILCWFLIINSFFIISNSYADTLKVGWDIWPPHQIKGENEKPSGPDIDLISDILNRAGFSVSFHRLPWKRQLLYLKVGKIDIVMSASKNLEREEYAYFSDSYFKLAYNCLYVRNEDAEKYKSVKTLKDFLNYNVHLGVKIGASYSKEYDELIKNKALMKKIIAVPNDIQNIRKLAIGRIDGLLCGEYAGTSKIKEAGLDGRIKKLVYLYGEKEASAFLMFSKKSITNKKLEKINRALKNMKLDGTHQKIINNYY